MGKVNKVLNIFLFLIAIVMSAAFFPDGAISVILSAPCVFLVIYTIRLTDLDDETRRFLTNVFLGALVARALLAIIIFGFELQIYFGPDAFTYDYAGNILANRWWGETLQEVNINFNSSGWGMYYIIGGIYFLTGQNALAGQLVISILGASTAVMAFLCTKEIFNNYRAARYAALFVAFFPAMVIWGSQLLKDGFIIFFLVLSLLAAIRLQERFRINWMLFLLIALIGVSSLRFYVFFMVTIALVGGFILGAKASSSDLITRFVICSVFGLAFSLLGISQMSQDQAEKYVNLEQLQNSRSYAAKAANSGLDIEEEDVSTTSGLISSMPLGLVTLYLAPFPWQVQSITQLLTMPEMLLWWVSLPFLLSGVIYAVRHRLRECAPILFFILMLSLTYAVYQGNLGTLYRQRAQIQVFLLILTAVGVVIYLEKKENVKLKNRVKQHPQRLSLIK
jgi:4-amino-4-deoxy-L-arabinose transferase-like glycosyltransferase